MDASAYCTFNDMSIIILAIRRETHYRYYGGRIDLVFGPSKDLKESKFISKNYCHGRVYGY